MRPSATGVEFETFVMYIKSEVKPLPPERVFTIANVAASPKGVVVTSSGSAYSWRQVIATFYRAHTCYDPLPR